MSGAFYVSSEMIRDLETILSILEDKHPDHKIRIRFAHFLSHLKEAIEIGSSGSILYTAVHMKEFALKNDAEFKTVLDELFVARNRIIDLEESALILEARNRK